MKNQTIPKLIATIRADLVASLRHFETARDEDDNRNLIRRLGRARRDLARLTQVLTEEARREIVARAQQELRGVATDEERMTIMKRAVGKVLDTMSPDAKLSLLAELQRKPRSAG